VNISKMASSYNQLNNNVYLLKKNMILEIGQNQEIWSKVEK